MTNNVGKVLNPINYGDFQIFNWRFGDSPWFWPFNQGLIVVVFCEFSNDIWEFLRSRNFQPFLGPEKSKWSISQFQPVFATWLGWKWPEILENLRNSKQTFEKPKKCNFANMGSRNWFGAKDKESWDIFNWKSENPQNNILAISRQKNKLFSIP